MEIRFSPEALNILKSIINNSWNISSAKSFINCVYNTIESLETNPNIFPEIQFSNIRKATVTKQVSMLYRVREDSIEILLFWVHRF